MPNHEIRLYRADGTLSIIVMTCGTLFDVNTQAASYLRGDIARAEVCSEQDAANNAACLELAA